MNVLVLGASGHLGCAIVREFVNRGHQVAGTGRSAEIPRNLTGVAFDYCPGDIDADSHLDQLIAGRDLVIDAAAPYSLNLLAASCDAERRPFEYAATRTERLVKYLLLHRVRFIYVSSSLAETPNDHSSLMSLQSKVVRKFYPYFRVKKLIEKRIHEAMAEGLQATIVRPTSCIGPWDAKPREMCWIPKLVGREIPATLKHDINVLDTRDLALAIGAAEKAGIDGKTITICGHNTTTGQVMTELCHAGEVEAPFLEIPAAMSIAPLAWTEMMWATLGRPSPLPSLIPALLCEQRWREPGAEQKQMGIELRSLSKTAHDTVDWYRELGYC